MKTTAVNIPSTDRTRIAPRLLGVAMIALLLGACRPSKVDSYQGYLEGDFVQVGGPLGGRLEQLRVAKGTRVAAGAPLYVLEHAAEEATRREAESRLDQARARLADLRRGQRPSELAALEARLAQTRSAAELSGLDLRRTESLFTQAVATASDLDRVRLTHERNRAAMDELTAQLETARLGGRADAIAAAEADVAAAEAAHARALWAVGQKSPAAPADSLVFDTLYREGEYVSAGAPVVVLLPPANLKVRFFVPESDRAALRPGQAVRVTGSGLAVPVEASISYLSPQPEFTPPVLYNRENRSKLVFMIEAMVVPDARRDLHPGQPVDVTVVR
jgi:HlyD family secretion protein